MSRICVCTKVGIATENPKRLFEENVDFDLLLGLQEQGEGMRVDYAQWTHGMPYNNAYGQRNLDRVIRTASCIAGTPVEFKSPKLYNEFMIVKYMFEAAMYKGQSFKAFMGREVHYCELNEGGTILGGMVPMIGMFGEDEDNYIKQLIKKCIVDKDVYNGLINSLSIEGCMIVNDIKNDDSILTDVDYIYAHSWYTADRAAQHGDGYAACVAMSSKRAPSWESINNANQTGWHTGEGALYLYTDYDRKQYDKENFLMSNIRVAYDYPGTTEDERERTPRAIAYNRYVLPKNSFAGSVQIQDKYIVAAMDFASYNYEGPDDHPDDSGGGGSAPIHLNDLGARKAWFMLDKKIVCLGAGIHSTMNSPVKTTVEHRRIVDAEGDNQFVSGELLPKCEYRKTYTGGWFNMPGHAGYVFSEGSEVDVERYVHEPAGNQSFIKVNLLHGTNPENASYCYTILPGADNETVEKFSKEPDFSIIKNTPELQAISCPSLDMKAFVFYAPADHGGIEASTPCIVVQESNKITLCDPTQEQEKVVIRVWAPLVITKKPNNVEIDVAKGSTLITVDVKNAFGKPFEIEFEHDNTNTYYKVSFSKEDEENFVKMSEDGLIAAYIYCDKVLKDGKGYKYNECDSNERAVVKSGVMMLPVSFFEKFLGKSAPDIERYISGGREYLPALEALSKLGLLAKTYYSDRLLVIGTEEHFDKIDKNPALEEAGAYAVFGKYDASKFTPEDYKAARQKWKRCLVGSPEINDLSNPTIKEKIELITKAGKASLANMNRGEDRVILFGDKPPVESDELGTQYSNLRRIAVAYGTYGSELYGSEEAKAAVIDGVQWMYENMYGEAEIAGTGWRDAHLFNWYWWFITAPECLTDIFFIMEDDFTLEDRRKYLKCFDWCSTFMRYWFEREFALSRICVCTKVGIATESTRRLLEENIDFDLLLGLQEQGEGPRVDFAQWTHRMPYNNAYGTLNLNRVVYAASCIAGTPVEFKSPKLYNEFMIIKYMFEAAMYKGQSFKAFMGRDIHYSEMNQGGAILGEMVPMLGMFGEDEDNYIKQLIKRCIVDKRVYKGILSRLSIEGCAKVNDIINDDTIPTDVDYIYAHSWYTADRAAQHGDGYAACVAMSSKREPAWESINSANKSGWHTGDGALYLYTDYDREQYDKENFLMSNINVAYNYPGTTEDERERTLRSIAGFTANVPTNSYAGSIQVRDKYIVAGMDFQSYNFEGPDSRPDDSGGGGSAPIHLNDLGAKKAWFMLDGKIICLGAGIHSTMNSPVKTTVEHRRIVDAEGDNQFVSGELLPKCEYRKTYTGGWFNMPGHAGYVFSEGSEVDVERYVHEPAGNQSFIKVNLLHGTNPENASYCYTILPGADNETVEKFSKEPDFSIIKNTPELQAISCPSLDMKAFVFYAPADHGGIEASTPCIVVQESNKITLCDPTQEQEKVVIRVWAPLVITKKPDNVEIDIAKGATLITVDTKNTYGKPIEIEFEHSGTDAYYNVSFFKKDEEDFVNMTEDGVIAAYIYCNKVLKDGQRFKYNDSDDEERMVVKNGVMMLPVSFFEKFLGKSAPDIERYISGGREYLPALEALSKLGLLAKTYYSDRLLVIGKEEHFDKIDKNPALEEAGAYAVFGKYDASCFTPEDYKRAREEWCLRLVGSPEINDLNDEDIKAKIAWRDSVCDKVLAEYNANADRKILFGEDKTPVESEELGKQFGNIEKLANAWGTYGSKWYHNEELLKTIISSMEWMYENMYGEAEIAGTGWRDVRLFNWWFWYYGGPDSLTNAMLIVNDYLTDDQRERFLKCYRWLRTIMYTNPKDGGAPSRLTPGAKAAILLEDAALLEQAQRDCDTCMGTSEHVGVHKADYLNWTHFFPHNISYGVINLQRALYVASILNDTPLAVSGPKRYNQFELVKYSFEPSIYRSQGFVMFSGRSTFASEATMGISVLAAVLPMIGSFGEDEDNYLKHFVKRNACNEHLIKQLKSGASIYDCAKLNDLLADKNVSAEYDYEYAHAWFTGDRAAQHRNNYAIGIAMSSRREMAYECINSANKTGWHTGDGATFLYTTYDGNQYDGKNFITNNINVAYRFPGTTEDNRERTIRSIASVYSYYPPNTFAGGMQIDKKFIVAGMDFVSYKYDGPDIKPDDYGYGGSLPIHQNDLGAKKAWFCLDGEIVCLGAGINSTMGAPVNTFVEHRRVVNKVTDDQIVCAENGEKTVLPKEENCEKTYTGAHWALMKGHAGYLFPKKCNLVVGAYDCEEAAGQRFFEVRISHGENPKEAKYEYVIMPYADEKALDKAYSEPTYETISNTEKLQAVRDFKTGVEAYVFYEGETCGNISAKNPCLLSVHRDGDAKVLCVSDATHKQNEVVIVLDGRINVIETVGKVSIVEKEGKTYFTFNVFSANGRRFEVKYTEA